MHDLRVLIDQKIILTGPVRPRSMADRALVREALRAARTK
jgi:hypothetical protein